MTCEKRALKHVSFVDYVGVNPITLSSTSTLVGRELLLPFINGYLFLFVCHS